ncbi:MAG: tetratricopeptide repeat protein [Phycisphaerae bacterium]
MAKITRYRSLAFAAIAAALLLSTGCEDMGKKQATMKQEQYNRWNATRLGVLLQLAQQQYEVGDYDKCRKTLDEAFATKAPSAPLHVLAAKVEIEKGSLEVAADHLQTAARIDPNNPEPFYLLGVVYQRWQKNDVAADYYQQAWDRKPGEVLYMLAVVEMKISLGKLDDAQKILEDKKVYFEQSAALRIALARIASLKNDHATACKYYRDAVILLPDDQKVRRSYAEELFAAKKYADAAAVFEDLRKNATGEEKESLLLLLADSYLNMRRPFDSRACLQEVVRDNPNHAVAYLMLAKTCIETGDTSIALASIHKVLQLEPDNTKAMILNAVIQQRQRNWADSRVTLERALKLTPADSTILCMIGRSAEELGKKSEAIAYYQKAVDANPKDTWAEGLLERAKGSTSSALKAPKPVAVAPAPEQPVAAAPAAEQPSPEPAESATPDHPASENTPVSASASVNEPHAP